MEKTANEELHDAMIRHQTYLMRYSSFVRNSINNILNSTEDAIANRIRNTLIGQQGLRTPADWARFQKLLSAISEVRGKAWDDATKYWSEESLALAKQEVISFQSLITTASPVVLQTVLPNSSMLRSVAIEKPFEGRILKEWASTMKSDDLRRIANSIQAGIVSGESSLAIARRVVGTSTLMGADGVTELTRKQVHSIVRTSINYVANASRTAFLEENINTSIIEEEMFVATLDSRTTPVCKANDGKRFAFGVGPMPPLHFSCRSLRVALFNKERLGNRPYKSSTQQQLLREYAEQNKLGDIKKRDYLPRGHKTSFDEFSRKRVRELTGNMPASVDYQTFLTRQTHQFQIDTMGATKAKLFRDGKLPLDRFVNRAGDELTLTELARREPSAFTAAGLNPKAY